MKAIETRYAGCRFRSRLEARWAVFFTRLGIAWQYEPEGFEIHPTTDTTWRWLPDFHLPELRTWVEIKGSDTQADDNYRRMLAVACDWNIGPPGIHESWTQGGGLLLLADIPDPDQQWAHTLIQHHKGIITVGAVFVAGGYRRALLPGTTDPADGFETGLPTNATFAAHPGQPADGTILDGAARDAYITARSARFEHGEQWQ